MSIQRHRQRGFLLIAAIIFVVIVGLISVIVVHLVSGDVEAGNQQEMAVKAFNVANAGLQEGLYAVTSLNPTDHVACAQLASQFSNVNFGGGQFSLTGTEYSPSVAITLTNSVSAAATMIPVSSLTGLAPYGQVMLSQELVNYQGTSSSAITCGTAPCLTGVTRGVGSSAAVSHSSGTAVGQEQCLLTAVGALPSLAAPQAKRTVSANAVHLEQAWAVGEGAGGAVVGEWNGSTWNRIDPAASGLPNKNLYAVYALSYSDIWAVGHNSETILHWDGNNWTEANRETSGPTSVPSVRFTGIYCNTAQDCWAVGQRHPNNATTIHWNGTIWSRFVVSPAVDKSLNAVTCTGTNNCWAVGDSRTFLHWDGTQWLLGTVIITGPNAVPNDDITGVACIGSNNCWASGENGLFAHWDGTDWQKQTISGFPSVNINSLYCFDGNNCWAVADNSGSAVLAKWDGSTWSQMTGGQLTNVPTVNFYAIDCSSANYCWAGGDNGQMIYWNGSTWTGGVSSNLPSTPIRGVAIIANEQPGAIGFWQQD